MTKQIKLPQRRSLNVVNPPPLGPALKPPPPPPKVPLADGYQAPKDPSNVLQNPSKASGK
jgi:hypothetical protein